RSLFGDALTLLLPCREDGGGGGPPAAERVVEGASGRQDPAGKPRYPAPGPPPPSRALRRAPPPPSSSGHGRRKTTEPNFTRTDLTPNALPPPLPRRPHIYAGRHRRLFHRRPVRR